MTRRKACGRAKEEELPTPDNLTYTVSLQTAVVGSCCAEVMSIVRRPVSQ